MELFAYWALAAARLIIIRFAADGLDGERGVTRACEVDRLKRHESGGGPDRYRNRRRRFGLRFFLIAALYNLELEAT